MVLSCVPFLMFTREGAEALTFYQSVFPDAQVRVVETYGEGEALPAGAIKHASLIIAGQELRLFDSPPLHDFTFTPSISFFIECADQVELHRLSEALAERGSMLMPTDNYGFSRLYAWVADRFGVAWQLNLT